MEKPTTSLSKPALPDRRKGQPPPPLFAQLLIEADWRPSDAAAVEGDGWFRAHGHAKDRRRS
jgi:hypothetical protein